MISAIPTTLTDKQRELWHLYGSTEAAALIGLNPYQSPIDIYRKHTGDQVDELDNHHIRRGVFLEQGLRRWAAHSLGHPILPGDTYTHTDYPLLRSTPDGIVVRSDDDDRRLGVLEVKFPGPNTSRQWDTTATDERGVPPMYVVQANQHMMCSGLRKAWVGAVIFGDLHLWELDYNEELARAIANAVSEFDELHVRPRNPPPPDGSPGYNDLLADVFPTADGERVQASDDVAAVMRTLREVDEELAMLNKTRARLQQELKATMGSAESMFAPGVGEVRWRDRKGSTSWKKAAEHLGATKDIAERFREPSTRAFTTKWESGQ